MKVHRLYFRNSKTAEEAENIVSGILGFVDMEHAGGLGNFDFGLRFETEQEIQPATRGRLLELSEAYGCVFNQ